MEATAQRHVDDDERRARLARRHAVAPWSRVEGPVAATRAMTVLHATEPPSVHLSCHARCDGLAVDDVERALYDDRSLVKQLAMRRTLFVFPRDLLPAAWGSAAARTAGAEERRLAGDVERSGVTADGAAWVDAAAAETLAHLSDGVERDARRVRGEVASLESRILFGGGKWAQEAPVAPRVVTLLGARGDLVRGRNGGHWRTSRPQWTTMEGWLGEPPAAVDERTGYAELVRRWLRTFAPGTEADLVWWLGGTKGAVRQALVDVEAVAVTLDGGATGWVLPDDLDPEPAPDADWAALLPVLDPTAMGWRGRDFYLDPDDVPYLVDSNGNIGTTAWWNGRVVGCWVQEDDGSVRVVCRTDPGPRARAALDAEAERLGAWLDGTVISSVYKSRQMKGETLP